MVMRLLLGTVTIGDADALKRFNPHPWPIICLNHGKYDNDNIALVSTYTIQKLNVSMGLPVYCYVM